MSTEPQPASVYEVVRAAVSIVDPTDTDAVLGDLLGAFEDADEPVTASLDRLDDRVATVLAELDPATTNPQLSMAAAMVLYLARRRDEVNAAPSDVLRLAARAEWHGRPPESVRAWLADRGVEV